ncbi:MAG: 50S ribosomal protein L24 [Candidatus Yanofskybacteria bacterium]|nr:50S ribosomal protein L24 [Candidatus Yanofskybacteria bacterium]
MFKLRIHKGDNVIMLNGKDRGKTGKILKLSPADGTAVIEGLNLVKRHIRARQQGQKGQVIARERSVALSSVALVCKSCGKPTRVGFQMDEQGANKIRVCKKCKSPV